jgi:D-beta-D-heptose 7-phosphate kinase / D-beta-D-heptose 1-phosphate adenosyltransferase
MAEQRHSPNRRPFMTTSLPAIVDRLRGLDVVVIGDAMLDTYVDGSTDRLCQEAPVPIVSVRHRTDEPGGAANVAVNVRAMGARATLVSVVGRDAEGERLRGALARKGVHTGDVLLDGSRRTLAKTRILSGGQLLVRVDAGSTDPVSRSMEETLVEQLDRLVSRCDALIVSDYGYGVVTPGVIRALSGLLGSGRPLVAVDAKDLARFRVLTPTVAKPNYGQAVDLLGEPRLSGAHRAEQISGKGQRLLRLTGARIVAVTLDADGAIVFEEDRPAYRTYARPLRHARAAGAGDTFLAALAASLATNAGTPAAAELASAAAAFVMGTDGTSACSARDLMEAISGQSKRLDPERVADRMDFYRSQGRRIILTNGCFDILHRGHITYLSRAKSLGDVLVVGVNSDPSVRRLKGPGRPVNSLEDRVEVLAALSCVDHIVVFEQDTPIELVATVRPDVFVKGGDYTEATLPEAPVVRKLGGTVHILPFIEDRSTTGIIERVRRANTADPVGSHAVG